MQLPVARRFGAFAQTSIPVAVLPPLFRTVTRTLWLPPGFSFFFWPLIPSLSTGGSGSPCAVAVTASGLST